MNRAALAASLLILALGAFACTDNSGGNNATGTAGTTGAGGTTGSGGAGGSTSGFTAVDPCSTESSYTTTGTTITFGATADTLRHFGM